MLTDVIILMQQELVVTGLLLLLLFLKLVNGVSHSRMLQISLVLLPLAMFRILQGVGQGSLFGGLYISNGLFVIEKVLLLAAVWLLLVLNYDWLEEQAHLPELLILVFSSLLGMMLMISSGSLLMFYLGLELAAIPAAALVNFDLARKSSAEGAMKMILSGAFASGIMLFGISLIYGATGTLVFQELSRVLQGDHLTITGFIFLFSGFAFKLSVVPFHFWTADVYEGAPAPVAAFLSVVSKAAVSFIFLTVLFRVFNSFEAWVHPLLMALSVLTLLIGNLFALRQQQLKRFLAFSSITQVGFILVAVSSGSTAGTTPVIYFLLVYMFSNLAAFAVVGIIAHQTGKERLDDLKGLYVNNKFLSWVLVISLFSLAGIPPTAGFFGKLFLILAGALHASVGFILIVALNIMVSLYYYLRLVRAVFIQGQQEPLAKVAVGRVAQWGLVICVIGILGIGLFGNIFEWILSHS